MIMAVSATSVATTLCTVDRSKLIKKQMNTSKSAVLNANFAEHCKTYLSIKIQMIAWETMVLLFYMFVKSNHILYSKLCLIKYVALKSEFSLSF